MNRSHLRRRQLARFTAPLTCADLSSFPMRGTEFLQPHQSHYLPLPTPSQMLLYPLPHRLNLSSLHNAISTHVLEQPNIHPLKPRLRSSRSPPFPLHILLGLSALTISAGTVTIQAIQYHLTHPSGCAIVSPASRISLLQSCR
jgi:hypothetical protein